MIRRRPRVTLQDFVNRGRRAQAAVDAVLADVTVPPTDTDRVRDALRPTPTTWHTLQEIAAVTGLTVARANNAVCCLVKQNRIDRQLPIADGQRKRGQRYRWKP